MKTKTRHEIKIFLTEVACNVEDQLELLDLRKVLRKQALAATPDFVENVFLLEDLHGRGLVLSSDHSTLWMGGVPMNKIHSCLVKEGYEQEALANVPTKIKWKTCIGYSLTPKE